MSGELDTMSGKDIISIYDNREQNPAAYKKLIDDLGIQVPSNAAVPQEVTLFVENYRLIIDEFAKIGIDVSNKSLASLDKLSDKVNALTDGNSLNANDPDVVALRDSPNFIKGIQQDVFSRALPGDLSVNSGAPHYSQNTEDLATILGSGDIVFDSNPSKMDDRLRKKGIAIKNGEGDFSLTSEEQQKVNAVGQQIIDRMGNNLDKDPEIKELLKATDGKGFDGKDGLTAEEVGDYVLARNASSTFGKINFSLETKFTGILSADQLSTVKEIGQQLYNDTHGISSKPLSQPVNTPGQQMRGAAGFEK